MKKALDAYRDTGLPINATSLARLGVGDSIAPRVMQAFRLLDLLSDEGEPTQALRDFREAPHDKYREVLAETLRAAYAPIFAVTGPNPGLRPPETIDDAFRLHEPSSLRPRMVRLFMGLSEYAGIIEQATKKKPGPRTGRAARSATNSKPKGKRQESDPPPPQDPPPPYVPPSRAPLDDARGRYVELLLAKAAEQDAPDAELLDRIERALGIAPDKGASP
jgi:hypothetical protein